MVGIRQQLAHGDSYTSSHRIQVHNDGPKKQRARPQNNPLRQRFRDAVNDIIQDGRRVKMKERLLKGLNGLDLETHRKDDDELKEIKNKKVRQYYERVNESLDDWLEVDTVVRYLADDVFDSFDPRDEDCDGYAEQRGILQQTGGDLEPFLPEAEQKKRQKERKYANWAVNINVIANVILVIVKVIAVFSSSSLSLVASLVDSILDLLCTVIIWGSTKVVNWKLNSLKARFPIGRRRLEPIGILLFSVIMVVSFLQILQESVQKLLPSGSHEVATLPPLAIGVMAGTVGLKGIIGIGCWRVKTTQVQALAQDCKTDVYFNVLSLLFPFIGKAAGVWWLDPVGAGLLSLYIIYDWAHTMLSQVARLTGVAVEDRTYRKLLFLAYRFSPIVDAYKQLTAYHAGDGIWVEVDLILDEQTTLEHLHDVAETLQYCLEGLDEVDRAFVSVDYATQGPTGHGLLR